jgi:hypothetical protein
LPPPEQKKPGQHSSVVRQNVGFAQHCPKSVQIWPAAQQTPPQTAPGHSHWHVVGLKTSLGPQGSTHAPVLGQTFDPGEQAQRRVLGSQKPLQHSVCSRQTVPSVRQRPGSALAPRAPTRVITLPTPAPASSLSACRRDVVVESDLVKSSK